MLALYTESVMIGAMKTYNLRFTFNKIQSPQLLDYISYNDSYTIILW